MRAPENDAFALFDDATWPDRPALLLSGSHGLIEAHTAEDVPDALGAIEAGVARGLTAAGYCAYELGYVFEKRLLPLLPATGRPLLRFHLFADARHLDGRARGRWTSERTNGPDFAGDVTAALKAADHRAKVERVRELIGDGDVYQVNLTFKLKAAGAAIHSRRMRRCARGRGRAHARSCVSATKTSCRFLRNCSSACATGASSRGR